MHPSLARDADAPRIRLRRREDGVRSDANRALRARSLDADDEGCCGGRGRGCSLDSRRGDGKGGDCGGGVPMLEKDSPMRADDRASRSEAFAAPATVIVEASGCPAGVDGSAAEERFGAGDRSLAPPPPPPGVKLV